MFKKLLPFWILISIALCSCDRDITTLDPAVVNSFEDTLQGELSANSDASLTIYEVSKISNSTFSFIINNLGLLNNVAPDELEIRTVACPELSKTRAEIRAELDNTGASRFIINFEPECIIDNVEFPYEGSLEFYIEGDLFAEGGRMTVSVLDQFTAHQINGYKLVFKGGKIYYDYLNIPGETSFDTRVENLIAQKEKKFVETIFNLKNIENGYTKFFEGDLDNDIDIPGTYLDDTAIFSFSGGLVERSDIEGIPKVDAIINPSVLEFGLLCSCPIGGILSITVNKTVFDTDYSLRKDDCNASSLLTIVDDGVLVAESIAGVRTFMPCDQ